MILAPLRGVTIRCFRETFATLLREGGFTEAITPFISALPGVDPLKNEELRMRSSFFTQNSQLPVAPQFIGKDPTALRACLERVRDVGFATADLNCGCPFPMVRRKGRGSGLLRTPDVLRRLLEVGCETMGLTLLVFEMEVLYILKIRSTLALVTSATRSIEVSKMSATFWAMIGMLALSLR